MSGMKAYPLDQLGALLRRLPAKYAAIAALGVASGCRVSEILPLRRRDLIDNGVIRADVRFGRLKSGNGKKHRVVRIPEVFFPFVERQLNIEYARGRCSDDDWAFPGQRGKHISRFAAYRTFRTYLGAGFGTHWMRKTNGINIYRHYLKKYAGDPVQAIEASRRALEHSRVDNTVKYLGIVEDDLDAARDEIFKDIFPNG